MKVCKGTLVEMIEIGEWVAPTCYYDDMNEGTWINNWLMYDPLGVLIPSAPDWYGFQNFFTICYT